MPFCYALHNMRTREERTADEGRFAAQTPSFRQRPLRSLPNHSPPPSPARQQALRNQPFQVEPMRAARAHELVVVRHHHNRSALVGRAS